MRYLILVAALAAAPAFADSEFRQGADWVRISALPCRDDKVLALIPADEQSDYRAARAEVGGQAFGGCWKPLFERQLIQLRYEDGDQGLVPFRDFATVPEA